MKHVVQEWLEFAKTDLKAAELLISDPMHSTGQAMAKKNNSGLSVSPW
jgi:hypothetical protein